MECKDNRSREKRHKMKTHSRYKGKYGANSNNNASSSSAQMENGTRGIIDIMDSSDEHYVGRQHWYQNKINLITNNEQESIESAESICDSRLSTGGSTTSTGYNKIQHPTTKRVQYGQSITTQIYSPSIPDIFDEIEENEQLNAGDFKLLAQYPTSVSSHFTFRSEKQWESAETDKYLDKTEASKYFTLNLKLLSAGLETIPFYKRMDYSSSLFTREQLNAMEQEAELAEKPYQEILNKHLNNSNLTANSDENIQHSGMNSGSGSAKSQKPESIINNNNKNNNNENDKIDDDLEELLQMTTTQVAKVNLDASPENVQHDITADIATTTNIEDISNTKDIQEWLDNVLDE